MHRGVAAACAAAISCVTLYPIDTWKVAAQLRATRISPAHIYAGIVPELYGTFLGTGLYFTTYEMTRDAISTSDAGTMIASASGVCASYLVRTPLSITKRRKQARSALQISPVVDWSPRILLRAYATDLARVMPRAIIKYTIYERLLAILASTLGRSEAAALSGAIAALGAYVVGVPLDNRKTSLAVAAKGGGFSFKGLGRGLLLTMASNAMGHALLERWAPR